MQGEVLTLQGTSWDTKIKAMISIGALFVCASSTLATHQFLTRYWTVLFIIGLTIVCTGIILSISRKLLKRNGYVSGDKKKKTKDEYIHPIFFKGKRLAG